MVTSSLTEVQRETLALFETAGEPRTTSEVANRLDLGRRTAYGRLERLVDHGCLETKKVGGNGRVWWQPPDTDATLDWSVGAESLVDDVLDGADVGIFVLDDDFDVAWINEATERYFGLDRERVVGRDKRRLVEREIAPVVDDDETFAERVLATYDDNTDTERFECRVTAGENRDARWLEHRSEPIESGAYAGGRVELYYDVTARRESERARHDTERRFRTLVDAVEEYAIFMLDPDGHVQTWNRGAERIKGYAAEEILGHHFSRFYTDDARDAGLPQRNLDVASERGSVEDEGWRLRADGSRFWADVTITAVRGDDGALDGYLKVTRDMTERRETERELRRERDFLDHVQEASPVGIGIFGPDGEARRTNRRFAELLGLDDADADYSLGQRPLLDPDGNVIPYRERPAPRALSTGETVIDQRGRVDGPDGRTRWLSVNARPLDGETEGVVVTMADVTQLETQARRLERRREDLQSELEEMFDRIDDAFYSLDGDLRFEYVNERASTLLERPAGELLGEYIWEALEPHPTAKTVFEEALATGESSSFEVYYEPLDAWLENRVYPSESGLSIYFRDVTERKERERELERYETIVETVNDGIYVVDDDGIFTHVNERYESMVGHSASELLGSHVSTVVDEAIARKANELEAALVAGERTTATLEAELTTPDGERRVGEATFALMEAGETYERVGVVRDVTERKRAKADLRESEERFRTLMEQSPFSMQICDAEGRVVEVNDAWERLWDTSSEVVVDYSVLDDEQLQAAGITPYLRDAYDGEAVTLPVAKYDPAEMGNPGRERWIQGYAYPLGSDDTAPSEIVIVQQDITERKQRERDLELYETIVSSMNDGVYVLDDEFCFEQVNDAYVEMTGYDREELLGTHCSLVVDDEVTAASARRMTEILDDAAEGGTLEADIHRADGTRLRAESNFTAISTETGDGTKKIGVVRDVSDRVARERKLERQRDQLQALNSLNEVVREITGAVVDQSTRDEIERVVCERLADSASYQYAWIGGVDAATQQVTPRAEAGVEGYHDGITISIDPDDERSDGPTGRALRTGEPQVTHDIQADSSHDPWRESIEPYGFRSSAAVPIVHEGTVYGVLNVYADRPSAFDGRERAVIGQLGEVVGHAIAAAERKQALMSDDLVELAFRIQDVFAALDIPADPDEPITLDHAVPVGDGEFLVYGTATSAAVDTVRSIAERLPHWQDLTIRSAGPPASFELRMTDPPVLSVVASLGGYVERAVIEDGDYRMRIHLAPSVDVRRVTDAVEAAYPDAEMLRRRQITRPRDDPRRLQRHVVEDLTDRQQVALETAYHAGFFEWPRDTTGEGIAESIGVSPPTFHQHLRKAQRKVLDAVFSSATQSVEA